MTAPYQSSLVTHSYSLWDSSFGSLRFDLALSKILLWAKKSGTSSNEEQFQESPYFEKVAVLIEELKDQPLFEKAQLSLRSYEKFLKNREIL